jgi:hypothetical protein
MHSGPFTISKRLYKVPLCVLYLIFFAVQVFYNYDIVQASGKHFGTSIFQAAGTTRHAAFEKHTDSGKKQQSKIRLNKRFQPATAPAVNAFSISAPICYTTASRPPAYSSPYIATPLLLTGTLRGPPASVCM